MCYPNCALVIQIFWNSRRLHALRRRRYARPRRYTASGKRARKARRMPAVPPPSRLTALELRNGANRSSSTAFQMFHLEKRLEVSAASFSPAASRTSPAPCRTPQRPPYRSYPTARRRASASSKPPPRPGAPAAAPSPRLVCTTCWTRALTKNIRLAACKPKLRYSSGLPAYH